MMLTNRLPVLFTLAVAIAGVSAQNFDQCGQTCINNTVARGICSSINDTSCVCSSTQFQTILANCLTANCSTSDLTTAEQLQKETCSNATTSSKPSASATAANGTSTAKSSSSPSTKSNGATAVEQLPFLSAVIVIASTLMGGAFVL